MYIYRHIYTHRVFQCEMKSISAKDMTVEIEGNQMVRVLMTFWGNELDFYQGSLQLFWKT